MTPLCLWVTLISLSFCVDGSQNDDAWKIPMPAESYFKHQRLTLLESLSPYVLTTSSLTTAEPATTKFVLPLVTTAVRALPSYLRVKSHTQDLLKTSLSGTQKHEQVPSNLREILLPTPTPTVVTSPGTPTNINALCHADRMYVRIRKDALESVKDVKLVKFGSCSVNGEDDTYFYFLNNLHGCGLKAEPGPDELVYSSILTYIPKSTWPDIVRRGPISVKVKCRFHRFFNVYKIGFQPIVSGRNFFHHLQTKWNPSLAALNSQWAPLTPGEHYVVGDVMHFEVRIPDNGKRVFVNRCHITASHPNSVPRFTVIDKYGCMVDSVNVTLSKFHRSTNQGVLRFTIVAFHFRDMDAAQGLFMHCETTAGETATPSRKACTYNEKSLRWEELYGDHSVCACCDSKSKCPSPTTVSAKSKMVSSDSWKMEFDHDPSIVASPEGSASEERLAHGLPTGVWDWDF